MKFFQTLFVKFFLFFCLLDNVSISIPKIECQVKETGLINHFLRYEGTLEEECYF